MDPAEFDRFVAELQQVAERNPRGYRLRVLALALAGYLYLAILVFVLVALLAVTVYAVGTLHALAIKLVFIVGGFLWIVLRAVWVTLEAPTGIAVTRHDAPALFTMLDRLRAELRTPRIDGVLVTGEFNAAMSQVPRLGLFGWYRNFLILGLPLMQALTPRQFEAVLAHELGHLAGGHGRMSNWVYRLRLMWHRLNLVLTDHDHWGSFVVRPFFNRYVPFFEAYSFPLARANEYEADAASARLTSSRSAAQALTAVNVVGAFMAERFWPGVYKRVADEPKPTIAPLSRIASALQSDIAPADRNQWLQAAMTRETSAADTHPSLKDRLRAMNVEPELLLAAPGEAADRLFGDARSRIEGQLDADWAKAVGPQWEQQHRALALGAERLCELVAKLAVEPLSEIESLERASLEEHVGGGATVALELRRALHAAFPQSIAVAFSLGRQLLNDDDLAGIALVGQAIASDPKAVAPGSELLRDFYWRRGDKENAYRWQRRLAAEAPQIAEAQRERSRWLLQDELAPHGLDASRLDALKRELAGVEGLERAYLVRKVLEQGGEALYLVGFSVTRKLQLHSSSRAQAAQRHIVEHCTFPGETLVVNLDGDNHKFEKKMRAIDGARIV